MTSAADAASKIRFALAKVALLPDVTAEDLDLAALQIAQKGLLLDVGDRWARGMRGGTAKSRSELQAINGAIIDLADRIDQLSPAARLELAKVQTGEDPTTRDVLEVLVDVNREVVRAHSRLSDPARTVSATKTKPSKSVSVAIAVYTAAHYERLTSREPRRNVRDGKEVGDFAALLTAVFEAIGLKASAENAAKRALEKRRATRSA